MPYKLVKISSYYKPFLDNYYNRHKTFVNKSYSEQYNNLMDQKFAWANFFQLHLKKQGVEVFEIISNANHLQKAWAQENKVSETGYDLLFSQIKKINPDVIFIQNSTDFNPEFIKAIRSSTKNIKLIFGNICSPYHKNHLNLFASFDFMLTCSPLFSEELDRNNIRNYNILHAFEPSILDSIKPKKEKNNEIIFIGSFFQSFDFHDERIQLIEEFLNEQINITIHGNLQNDTFLSLLSKQFLYITLKNLDKLNLSVLYKKFEKLRKVSALHEFPTKSVFSKAFLESIKDPLYGKDMYQKIAESTVGLNIHGGIVKNYAANMRMFEVTGVGSCLLTDYKSNLKDLFEIDSEIVTFKNKSELLSKSKYLLENPNEALKIAEAGQKRTLKDHNLENRINQIHELTVSELKKI